MQTTPAASSRLPRSTPAIVLALVLLAALGAGGLTVLSVVRLVPGTSMPAEALSASDWAAAQAPNTLRTPRLNAGPGWEVLTTAQKLALYPLAERWAYLSQAQKRRWLALAQTFHSMPEGEQQRLHDRMTAWAGLSVQQRSQARLNFAVTRALAPSDIQSQWEAYQALSDADKKRLAARAPKPRGAATALKPIPSKRLAHLPAPSDEQALAANPPKIVLPATAAVRQAPVPAPVALPPALPSAPGSTETTGESPTEASPAAASEPRSALPSDPLPDLYVN